MTRALNQDTESDAVDEGFFVRMGRGFPAVLFPAALFAAITVAAGVIRSTTDISVGGTDDANIYFVYAKNLIEGNGIVYNSAGPRVEGFTSPLWELLCVAALGAGLSLERTLFLAGVSCCAVTLALLKSLFSGDRATWLIGGMIALWAIGSPVYLLWNTLSLMDMPLWGLFFSYGFVSLFWVLRKPASLPRRLGFALAAGLSVLARPEALLVSIIWISLFFVLVFRAGETLKSALRYLLLPAGSFLFFGCGATLFRMIYFGYPLPNTYYAKVSEDTAGNVADGLVYLGGFFSEFPVVIVSVTAACFLFWRALSEDDKAAEPNRDLIISAAALVALVVPVLTGGDHFGHNRFYAQHWPVFVLPIIAASKNVRPERQRIAVGVALLLILFSAFTCRYGWTNVWRGEASDIQSEFLVADYGRTVGEGLNRTFEDKSEFPSIGVIAAGGIAFTYKGDVVDLVGLNNPVMAHADRNKEGVKNHAGFHPATFFRQAPDLVIPWVWFYPTSELEGRMAALESGFENRVLKGLLTDGRFLDSYRREPLEIFPGQFLVTYRRTSK